MTARTPELEAQYTAAREAGELMSLDEIPPYKGREWKYWKYAICKFHHNKLNTKQHYMVVLKRKCLPWQETKEEILELHQEIFPELDKERQYAKVNFEELRSVKDVPHWHVADHLPEFV